MNMRASWKRWVRFEGGASFVRRRSRKRNWRYKKRGARERNVVSNVFLQDLRQKLQECKNSFKPRETLSKMRGLWRSYGGGCGKTQSRLSKKVSLQALQVFLEIARDAKVAEPDTRSTFVFRQRSRVISVEGAPDGGMYAHKTNGSQQQTTRALADSWR